MTTLRDINELNETWAFAHVFDHVEVALAAIGFDDTYVASAIASRRATSRHTKVIKDGIWGMVEVGASHLRLLDCPILQRLRTIHQLGFSYLTYPSAEHSRFAHSLGMFSVVSRFLQEIRRRQPAGPAPDSAYYDWVPTPEQILIAEHAAILHDIGHMPFSHVTEQILHGHSEKFTCGPLSVDEFTFPAENLLSKSKLAELLSVAIVLSPRFRRFYGEYVALDGVPNGPETIAALILGIEPEPSLAGVANLISGSAIDADKIDYINRDARACGIAVGIDVSRLFMRSRFLTVSPDELKRLRSTPEAPANSEVVFVVNASGLDSIEEIGQARTMLYHRVYLHQTTRNAERLLGKALQSGLLESEKSPLTDALELWVLDDFGLLRTIAQGRNEVAAGLGRRLRARQLPKRASSFGRRFVRMSVPITSVFPRMDPKEVRRLAKQVVGTGLEQFRSNVLRGTSQADLEQQIVDEAIQLRDNFHRVGKAAPPGEPTVAVLPMPSIEENRIDCIILDNEQLTLTSASSVSDEQMEASDIMKATGYVLCDPEWRSIVFLASRKAFYDRSLVEHDVSIEPFPGDRLTVKGASRLLLNEEAIAQRIRMSSSEMDMAFADASAVGFFDRTPRLVPVSCDRNKVAQAASLLGDFIGHGNWRVSDETVSAFLSQFPDQLRDEVLGLILAFTSLGRVELVTSIRDSLQSIDLKGTQGFVTSLSPDSGGSVRTVAEQELTSQVGPGWSFKKTIRDVFETAEEGDTLVLCDDNVTSGSQAICQFLAWMDAPRSGWTREQLQERGIETSALSVRDRELLKKLELWIVVATGGAGAEDKLKTAIEPLGLDKFQGVKMAKELGSSTRAISAELETFLTNAGTSILAWCRHGAKNPADLTDTDREECQRDALGYSGAKALICTLLNVPVGTFTAFWAPGYVNDEPWMPLLIRRGYLQHLVLS